LRSAAENYTHKRVSKINRALHDVLKLHDITDTCIIMNSYEIQRLENIEQNQKVLAELNLHSHKRNVGSNRDAKPPAAKRRRVGNAPSRTSARIASAGRPSYNEGSGEKYVEVERVRTAKTKGSNKTKPKIEDYGIRDVGLVPSQDAETIRAGWTSWTPSAPPPTRDEHGTFHFDSHPTFLPNKSPEEVIREGCFGGSYFRPLKSRKLGIVIEDDYKELPAAWTDGLDASRYLTSPRYDPEVNKFKVACGQSIEEWEAAGWINHDHDVRGWFQWYIRFFQGRRCKDDERQVSRWRKCVGETGRWRRMLLKKYMTLGVRDVFDDGTDEDAPEVSPVMHQTCHHWAFEVRQNVLDEFWRTGR
jgi:hypothetical protein